MEKIEKPGGNEREWRLKCKWKREESGKGKRENYKQKLKRIQEKQERSKVKRNRKKGREKGKG